MQRLTCYLQVLESRSPTDLIVFGWKWSRRLLMVDEGLLFRSGWTQAERMRTSGLTRAF